MTTFIDVGVVRIQGYLGRWPSLRGVRGASALLVEATATDAVLASLPPGWRPNHDAGDADGVVHLAHDGPLRPAAGQAAVDAVLAHIRERAPAAELSGTITEAASYAEATAAGTGSGSAHRSFGALSELPVLRRCTRCRVDPAEAEVWEHDEGAVAACRDCAARDEASHRRTKAGRHPLTPEEWLRREVGAGEAAATFADLAALGPEVRGLKNHLATVKADGNGLGAFFAGLADEGSGAKQAVSAGVEAATRTALAEATRCLGSDLAVLPVIPHVAGGDDLVVTLPAGWAWTFTRRFLAAFEAALAPVVTAAVEPDVRRRMGPGRLRLTASAGIAFAHSHHPFTAAADLAEAALDRAKAQAPGVGAVCWLDRTRDGDALPAGRRALTMEALDGVPGQPGVAPVLDQLAGMGASRRHALEAAVAHPDAATARGRLRREVDRLGVERPAGPWLHYAEPGQAADALAAARWWTKEPA